MDTEATGVRTVPILLPGEAIPELRIKLQLQLPVLQPDLMIHGDRIRELQVQMSVQENPIMLQGEM